jgi:hypothetical protein
VDASKLLPENDVTASEQPTSEEDTNTTAE